MKPIRSQSFRFDPISATNGIIRVQTNSGASLAIRAGVDDGQMGRFGIVSPLVADLIDLGMALWVSDRMTSDRRHRSSEIPVIVALRCANRFSRPKGCSACRDL